MAVNLETSVGALSLTNPVMAASGTFGFGPEYGPLVNLGRLGGVAVKGVSPIPWPGNPPPPRVGNRRGSAQLDWPAKPWGGGVLPR